MCYKTIYFTLVLYNFRVYLLPPKFYIIPFSIQNSCHNQVSHYRLRIIDLVSITIKCFFFLFVFNLLINTNQPCIQTHFIDTKNLFYKLHTDVTTTICIYCTPNKKPQYTYTSCRINCSLTTHDHKVPAQKPSTLVRVLIVYLDRISHAL